MVSVDSSSGKALCALCGALGELIGPWTKVLYVDVSLSGRRVVQCVASSSSQDRPLCEEPISDPNPEGGISGRCLPQRTSPVPSTNDSSTPSSKALNEPGLSSSQAEIQMPRFPTPPTLMSPSMKSTITPSAASPRPGLSPLRQGWLRRGCCRARHLARSRRPVHLLGEARWRRLLADQEERPRSCR